MEIQTIKHLIETMKTYLPIVDEEKVVKAYKFAENAHLGQSRASGEPYITHPLAAAFILTEIQADENTIIACLLHDVPEDTKETITNIEKKFGSTVAMLVHGVTKLSKVYYQNNMQAAQVASLKRLFLVMAKDKRVMTIKLADRLHNMSTLQYIRAEKRGRIATETLKIYVPLANLLGIWHIQTQLEELCMRHLYPKAYEAISNHLYPNEKHHLGVEKKLKDTLRQILQDHNIQTKVETYPKSIYGIYCKFTQENIPFDNVRERFTIRVITKTIADCYSALGVIHTVWKPQAGKFRDYIAVPKNNDYQSLHTKVFTDKGEIVEIQIRTENMHQKAELGIMSDQCNLKGKRESWLEEILAAIKSNKKNKHFVDNLGLENLQKRIFVFTPEGDVVDLKKGSTPLDFAYAIHSNLGNNYLKAEVNDKAVNMNQALKTGNVIKIFTDKSVRPKAEWLSTVKTNLAKKYIKRYLKRFPKLHKIQKGKSLLAETLEVIGRKNYLNNRQIHKLMNVYDKKSGEEVFQAIGEGEISVHDIVEILYERDYADSLTWLEKKRRHFFGGSHFHRRVMLHIDIYDRVGIIADIGNIAQKLDVNIQNIKTVIRKYPVDTIKMSITVNSLKQLQEFFEKITRIKDVVAIQRIYEKEGTILKTIFRFNILYWISQPLVLIFLQTENRLIAGTYFSFGIALSLLSTYYFQKIMKYLILKNRSREKLWNRLLVVNLSICLLIIVEELYFKIPIHWGWITSFILFLAGNTITEFYQHVYAKK